MKSLDEAWSAYLGSTPDRSDWSHAKEDFEAGWNAVLEAAGNEHIVEVTHTGWTMQHPVSERLDGSLFDCKLPRLVGVALREGLLRPGRHLVWIDRGSLRWDDES